MSKQIPKRYVEITFKVLTGLKISPMNTAYEIEIMKDEMLQTAKDYIAEKCLSSEFEIILED